MSLLSPITVLESVADQLEGWAEYHASMVRSLPDGEKCNEHKNMRDNYTKLAETIRRQVERVRNGDKS